MTFPTRAHVVGLTFLALTATSAAAQSILNQYGEIVHGSGQAPPSSNGIATDFPAGSVMGKGSGYWLPPAIDLNGTVIYRARCVDGGGIDQSNGWAFYMGRASGDVRMVVRGGDQAPGLAPGILLRNSGTSLTGLGSMRISPTSEVLVWGSTLYDGGSTVTTTNDTAMFWGPAGSFLVLAREGDPVPTLAGGELYGPMPTAANQQFLVSSSGTTMFKNTLSGPNVTSLNDAAVFAGTPGSVQLIAREGDLWAGVGATGERLDRFSGNSNFEVWSFVNQNENGHILHDVHFQIDALTTPAVTTANDRAVAIWISGTDVPVVREGDPAPGMPTGVVFADPSAFTSFASIPGNGFNKSGTLVFQSTFPAGPGVSSTNDTAMFMGGVGSLSMVLREGDPAPASLGAGVLWGTPNTNSVSLNDTGELAFYASISDGGVTVTTLNDSAVFTGTPGNFTVVAREGDAAPGLPGWTFANINPNPLLLNSHGNLAFPQNVTNGTTNKSCWFCWTAEHGLRLFADLAEVWNLPLGATTLPLQGLNNSGGIQGGDTGSMMFGNNGDIVFVMHTATAEPGLPGSAIIRGHVGSLIGTPSSVPVAGGVPHNFYLDVGPTYGNQYYFILATSGGTRPGFPHPLNFAVNVPMNFDPTWTTVSQAWVNTALWTNTLFVTDASGKPLGNPPISFNMPAGFPGFLGTTLHHSALLFDVALVGTFATEPVAVKLY